MTAQGYFEYDSKKSRGLTVSHLRFGKSPIRSTYLIHEADFVACHNPVYLHKYNMVQELKENGIFLLNCGYGAQELEGYLPDAVKAFLAKQHIRFYVIDALKIGKEIGLNGKISTILQAAFFAVSKLLPPEDAKLWMNQAAEKSYGKSGGKILEMNRQAIHRGFEEVTEIAVPQGWQDIPCEAGQNKREHHSCTSCMGENTHSSACVHTASHVPSHSQNPLDNAPLWDRLEMMEFVKKIQQPVTDQRGDELPVSAFLPYADGYTPPGSTAHERRAVATEIPVWKPENCIQCARCSFFCPHGVIRPAVLDEEVLANAPEGLKTIPMFGVDDRLFAITLSPSDCTGCGTCAAVCPGKRKSPDQEPAKALEMVPVTRLSEQDSSLCQRAFDYCKPLLPCPEALEKFATGTLKGSQFRRPLMEFSGACAGCGETAYVKLLTQLFGPRMYIANATGCSSIWGNSAPSCAYALDADGRGPAWSNSLFEDAAEFGFGMLMAQEAAALRSNGANIAQDGTDPFPPTHSREGADTPSSENVSPSAVQWVIGGDGWAYDIGFGGLDEVLASGENINVLVLDTEGYSNTGGEMSKATELSSVSGFTLDGKPTPRKDLGRMMMQYGYVYVAQVCLGANMGQTIAALREAEAYDGPSIVIALCPCISWGIKGGMSTNLRVAREGVEAGYWPLFRFNPQQAAAGHDPLTVDYRAPDGHLDDFLNRQDRFTSLLARDPARARTLHSELSKDLAREYTELERTVKVYEPEA